MNRYERSGAEPLDFYRYYGMIAKLDKQPTIDASQVRSLLELKEKVLKINPTDAMTDQTFLRVTLDRWDRGNRVSALEYVFREAFETKAFKGDMWNYDAYKGWASFWLKCAEGLIREPLCEGQKMYELMKEKIRQKRDSDSELYDVIATALVWNQLAWLPDDPGIDTLIDAYTRYCDFKTELFGPGILS